jgi:two-component system phosphate regulon response regulator OmpR
MRTDQHAHFLAARLGGNLRAEGWGMDDSKHIMIVDDDPDLRDTFHEYFEANGFKVSSVADGQGMRRVLKDAPADIVIMDLHLPGEDGLALTRELRGQGGEVGIIMLTGVGDTVDRIVGLEVGADDYLSKPVDLRELLARVKSVLRRTQRDAASEAAPAADGGEKVRMGSCIFDLAAHRLYDAEGREIALTSMEFDLLKAFAQNPNRVLSRERLLDLAHNRDADVFDRSIDVRITRIRKKIEIDPEKPQVLKTVRGAGYMFVQERTKRRDDH